MSNSNLKLFLNWVQYNSLKLNPDSSTTDNGLEYYARLSATNNSTGSIEYSSKNWDTSSVYDIYSLVENSAYKWIVKVDETRLTGNPVTGIYSTTLL